MRNALQIIAETSVNGGSLLPAQLELRTDDFKLRPGNVLDPRIGASASVHSLRGELAQEEGVFSIVQTKDRIQAVRLVCPILSSTESEFGLGPAFRNPASHQLSR